MAVPIEGIVPLSYLGCSLVAGRAEVVTVTNELEEGCGTLVGVTTRLAVFPPPCGLSMKDGGSAAGQLPWPLGLGSALTFPNFPGLGMFRSCPLSPVVHVSGVFATKTGGSELMSSSSSVPPTMLTGAQFMYISRLPILLNQVNAKVAFSLFRMPLGMGTSNCLTHSVPLSLPHCGPFSLPSLSFSIVSRFPAALAGHCGNRS